MRIFAPNELQQWLTEVQQWLPPNTNPLLQLITPPDPGTLVSSATAFNMAGCAVVVSPHMTGRLVCRVSGNAGSTMPNAAFAIQIAYGADQPPAKNDPAAGAQVGEVFKQTAQGTALLPFTLQAFATGLIIGASYWFDLASQAQSGNVELANLSFSFLEF